MKNTITSLQRSASFHACQHTIPSPTKGSTVMLPVRKRSSLSLATGWTSSAVGAIAMARNSTACVGVLPCRTFEPGRLLGKAVHDRSCYATASSAFAAHVRRGGKEHGDRYREVVQRRQGLRVHHARRARQGPLRPFLRHRR